MQLYLPIAEISVNFFLLLGLGGIAGLMAGLFGVGGGFLLTPLLIFIGIPPSVAVATSANQTVASSLSGFLGHWHRGQVDFKMGLMLLLGGLIGSSAGVLLFGWLKSTGNIDLIISLCYVIFLWLVGGLMTWESVRTWQKSRHRKNAAPLEPLPEKPHWQDRLPVRIAFPRSNIQLSVLLPLAVGALVGVLVSLMGVGGGFLLVPAMIYLLRMPASMVVGTSLFQIIFITANVTIMQSVLTQTVDILLAVCLLTGSAIGAQVGLRFSNKLPADTMRAMLAVIVMGIAIKLGYSLFATPDDPFSFTITPSPAQEEP